MSQAVCFRKELRSSQPQSLSSPNLRAWRNPSERSGRYDVVEMNLTGSKSTVRLGCTSQHTASTLSPAVHTHRKSEQDKSANAASPFSNQRYAHETPLDKLSTLTELVHPISLLRRSAI